MQQNRKKLTHRLRTLKSICTEASSLGLSSPDPVTDLRRGQTYIPTDLLQQWETICEEPPKLTEENTAHTLLIHAIRTTRSEIKQMDSDHNKECTAKARAHMQRLIDQRDRRQ